MAITLVEYAKKHSGTRYDPDRRKWIGYRIDVYVGGKRLRDRRFPTQRKAEDFINELKDKQKHARRGIKYHARTASDVKLKDLIDVRLAEIAERKKKALLTRVLNYFLAIVGETARVTDITHQHLKDFNRKRLSEKTRGRDTPVAESTVDREMTEISSLLQTAGNYFEELESYEPPKIPRLKLPDIRRERTIADEEREALVNYFARPRGKFESDRQYFDRLTIGHSFEFAGLTSSRRKEVVRLKKTDYYPQQDILKITRWKTIRAKKQSVSIFSPVPKRVREILELRNGLDPESEYFFSCDGSDSQGYLKALKLACEKLGIKYGRFTDGGLIFHDTRHTFVTTLIEGGVDLETARDLAGLSRDMILRYAHATPESKKRAVEVLDRQSKNNYLDIQKNLAAIYENVKGGSMDLDGFLTQIFNLWAQNGHKTKAASK
jgi:hypothetical protein